MAKPKFNPHDYDSLGIGNLPDILVDAALDDNARKSNGDALNGGGIPGTGWEVQNNGPFQLATNVHYRQGDFVQPDSVDGHNVMTYHMPDGPQVVDNPNGVSTAAANRGATSFDYSFSTAHTGGLTIQEFLANGGEFIWKLDLDPSQKNNPLVLHAVYDASNTPTGNPTGSHVVWQDAAGHVWINDDAGNEFVTQNSRNLAFYQQFIDTDPHAPGIQPGGVSPAGQYTIESEIVINHHVVADLTTNLILV
jgi:hypothetical protein